MQAEAGGQFWGSSSIVLYLRLVWFDWLGCRCNSSAPTFPTDTGSQFIALSGAASMLQAWQLGRIRGQWRERLTRASFSLLRSAIRWAGFSATFACHLDFLPEEDGPNLRKPWVQTYLVCLQTFPSGLWGQMWENKHWFESRHVEYLLESRHCAMSWWGKYE